MGWFEILKVQVLGNKQKVKMGIKPLPKEDKPSCNDILQEKIDKLKSLMDEGWTEKWYLNQMETLELVRPIERYGGDGGKEGIKVIGNRGFTLNWLFSFKRYVDENKACEILEKLKDPESVNFLGSGSLSGKVPAGFVFNTMEDEGYIGEVHMHIYINTLNAHNEEWLNSDDYENVSDSYRELLLNTIRPKIYAILKQ